MEGNEARLKTPIFGDSRLSGIRGLVSPRLTQSELDILLLFAALYPNGDGVPGKQRLKYPAQVIEVADHLVVDLEDDIFRLEPGLFRRALRVHGLDDDLV